MEQNYWYYLKILRCVNWSKVIFTSNLNQVSRIGMINLGLLQRKFNVLYVLFSVPLHLSFSGLAAVLLEFMRNVGKTLTKTLLVLYVRLRRYINISPIRHGILNIQSAY